MYRRCVLQDTLGFIGSMYICTKVYTWTYFHRFTCTGFYLIGLIGVFMLLYHLCDNLNISIFSPCLPFSTLGVIKDTLGYIGIIT